MGYHVAHIPVAEDGAHIGIWLTATSPEELGTMIAELPGLSDVIIDDPAAFTEIIRITVAGKTILSIRPKRPQPCPHCAPPEASHGS